MQRAVLFFVKYPEPGKVKTRLAATVGPAEAAAIYRRLVEAVCISLPADSAVVVMFEPPHQRALIEQWLHEVLPGASMSAQVPGDLGVRLENAFASAFSNGFEKVAAIGSDCIELDAQLFAETWRALDANDCVIGPTADGGYYLLALRAPAPLLFAGIDWSTSAVFAQTLERAHDGGLRVHVLPKLHDVDTEDDWRRAEQRLIG